MKFKNILLIDDNDVDNYINNYVLEECRVAENITIMSSAIDALEYLRALEEDFPNVIFLDINMPIMDGFEFLKEYDEFPPEKKEKCSIFMLTSSNDPADIEKANNNAYVKKFLTKSLNEDMIAGLF